MSPQLNLSWLSRMGWIRQATRYGPSASASFLNRRSFCPVWKDICSIRALIPPHYRYSGEIGHKLCPFNYVRPYISREHHVVLFLDEVPEFKRNVLKALASRSKKPLLERATSPDGYEAFIMGRPVMSFIYIGQYIQRIKRKCPRYIAPSLILRCLFPDHTLPILLHISFLLHNTC